MYLYLGKDLAVPKAEVIGVFDLDNCTSTRITRDFLSRAEKRGRMTDVSAGALPKSFVLCAKERRRNAPARVFLAQPNPATLLKRWKENTLSFNI